MRQNDPTRPVEGAQDLYPRDVRLRARLSQTIAGVLDRYGFEPWDAPLLEPLSLYEAGKNLPLVENQALVFQGPLQEPLVLRAELTPSLSRVVAGLNSHLVLPLRWYSYGPFWRNESLRLGRGREFRQWNIDVVGAPAPLMDTEMVTLAIEILRAVGLGPDQVRIRLSSRALLAAALEQVRLPAAWLPALLQIVEVRAGSRDGEWRQVAHNAGFAPGQLDALEQFLDDSEGWQRDATLCTIMDTVDALGLGDYVAYDPGIVRAAVYYTGLVFEAFYLHDGLPAILGGGRYDGMVKSAEGKALPACGFAIGDLALIEVLEMTGQTPAFDSRTPLVSILVVHPGESSLAHQLAMSLRGSGVHTELSSQPPATAHGEPGGGRDPVRFVARPVKDASDQGQFAITDTETGERSVRSLADAIAYLAGS